MLNSKNNILNATGMIVLVLASVLLIQAAPKQEFYQIKIYTIASTEQEKTIDDFLKNAYLPALHRAGISKAGVFKPVESDTALFGKRIFVFIPFSSLDQFTSLEATLQKDKQYLEAGKNYIDAPYTNPPYTRIESAILKAFSHQPKFDLPKLASPLSQRVYELRSYESHTEKIHKNKVQMFNEGGEVTLFKRLNFNAVFYGEVLSGSHMPNLMYMTTFESMDDRNAHWKTFGDDAEWKKLSAMAEYKNNVSKNTQYLLHPTDYSDF